MIVGTVKDIKNHEYRVGLTPESTAELVEHGHSVLVERSAGLGIGADDDAYAAAGAELVDGAVPIPGAAAPKLARREDLALMPPGAVLVDVAIDQGGCFETSRATPHAEPTYEVDGIVHDCVANMPGGVARTSTYALNNVTLPFALQIAGKGRKAAPGSDPHQANGLNVWNGQITNVPVAEALGYRLTPLRIALA